MLQTKQVLKRNSTYKDGREEFSEGGTGIISTSTSIDLTEHLGA